MSCETFLLAGNRPPSRQRLVRHLSSPSAVEKVAGTKHAASNWVVESAFIPWLQAAQTKNDSLFLLDRPRPSLAAILRTRFGKVWTPDDARSVLPTSDLLEVLASTKRHELFVGGVVDEGEEVVLLLRGDLTFIEAPFQVFPASGTAKPDFGRFAVVEYGTAIALGDYVATADSILYELDPKYRKRAKERRLAGDDSFGGSLKRLRMLRGLSQSDFEPHVSAKQVARIEANETKAPRAETVKRLAKRLGVKPDVFASY